MAADAILTPDQLIAQRRQALAQTPPILPLDWNATFILSPFGDATPPMNNYDQLVIADVTCFNDFIAGNGMRVSLYLLEELQYFDFAFSGGQWYWLESQPGQEPTNYAGPFPTSLQPLNVGLLAQAVYGGQWAVAGTLTDGWVVPTQNVQPQHGNWYSLRSEDRILWRVLNVDLNNPLNVPILGAYFMVNVSNYTPLPAYLLPPPFVKMLREGKGKAVAGAQSPLVTQRDIQNAMANPIFSASCTLQQIQALVPGITPPPTPMPPLPAWTDQVYIRGWTLGGDYFPYYTQVWYDYTIPCQRSEFIGFGNNVGQNTYNDRQDTVLYANYTNNPVYQWQGPPISALAIQLLQSATPRRRRPGSEFPPGRQRHHQGHHHRQSELRACCGRDFADHPRHDAARPRPGPDSLGFLAVVHRRFDGRVLLRVQLCRSGRP